MNSPRSYVDESPSKRVLRSTLVVALVVVLLLAAWSTKTVLLVIFAGVLFGILLRGLSEMLARKTPLGPRWSLAVLLLATISITAAAFYWVAPEVSRQVDELSTELPKSIQQLRGNLEATGVGQWALDRISQVDQWMTDQRAVSQARTFVTSTFAAVGGILIIIAVGIYFAVEPQVYRDGLVRLVPPAHRERAHEVLGAVRENLQWWLIGRFVGMAIIGVATWAGLSLLGIPLALVLAVIAALLTFVPNIGPVLSVVPAALLALLQSPTTVLYVVLLYLGVQAVESYILTPLIQRKAVHIPPAMLLSAQLVMGVYAGILGLALATPLLAALMVCVKMLYIEDTLEKSP